MYLNQQNIENEIYYFLAEKILLKMLENKLINQEEFTKIEDSNHQSFPRVLDVLMAEKA